MNSKFMNVPSKNRMWHFYTPAAEGEAEHHGTKQSGSLIAHWSLPVYGICVKEAAENIALRSCKMLKQSRKRQRPHD
jgi:hypothetical protein